MLSGRRSGDARAFEFALGVIVYHRTSDSVADLVPQKTRVVLHMNEEVFTTVSWGDIAKAFLKEDFLDSSSAGDATRRGNEKCLHCIAGKVSKLWQKVIGTMSCDQFHKVIYDIAAQASANLNQCLITGPTSICIVLTPSLGIFADVQQMLL